MKFQERFAETLKTSQMTQSELAKKVGVAKQCISDYKKGRAVPSLETLFRLCVELDVSSDYLLGLAEY